MQRRITSAVGWLFIHPGSSWPTYQTLSLHSNTWLHHFSWTLPLIPFTCLFKTWCTITHHIWLQSRVCITLLPIPWQTIEHGAPFYIRTSPRRRWSDRAHQSNPGTIPKILYKLSAGQFGHPYYRLRNLPTTMPIMCQLGFPPFLPIKVTTQHWW